MKLKRILLLGVGVPLIAIQFFRPEKVVSDIPAGQTFEAAFAVPADVAEYLKVGCYDCHSNAPRYPWYSNVQPIGWWLAEHIEDGSKHLNFDNLHKAPARIKYHKFEEIEEMVAENEMPLPSYLWTHGDAELDDEKKKMMLDWAKSVMKGMDAKYPPDSLRMRRKSKPAKADHDEESHDDDSH